MVGLLKEFIPHLTLAVFTASSRSGRDVNGRQPWTVRWLSSARSGVLSSAFILFGGNIRGREHGLLTTPRRRRSFGHSLAYV